MSNIAVVPRFQKLWELTSDLESAGTTTYPGCPINLSAPINRSCPTPLGLSYGFHDVVNFSPFLPRSGLGPPSLHYPTVDFRFVSDSARDEGPRSKGAPLLCGVVVPRQNKAPLWT